MEPQDQVSNSDKPASENEGIELQVRNSSDVLSSEGDDPGSVTGHLQEIKSLSREVDCAPDKVEDISSIESNNDTAESKLEVSLEEPRDVSVEKGESLDPLSELSSMSVKKEKLDTIPVEVIDISQEKDLSQTITTEALTGGENFETTDPSFSTSNDKALSHTNKQASSDNLNEQSSDGGKELKFAKEVCQTFNSGTLGGVISLQYICVKQEDTKSGNLQEDSDSLNQKSETHGNRESISTDKVQISKSVSETACNESVAMKNPADVTTALESNSTADVSEKASEENVLNEQSRIPAVTANKENITCKSLGATTKNTSDENVDDKHSRGTPETVGEGVTKKHANTASKTEILHKKKGGNTTNAQLPTAKTAVCENISDETADVGICETEPREPSVSSQPGETEDNSERRAFFYISSCSVPGMGKEWEWPSVSNSYQYQRPPRRMERRRNTSESRNCLGTQRCHYIILAVGVLGAILGCLTYHLQDYGIGPKVLRPIGASAAFLSFVVCAFSSVYLTYLSYYTQPRSSPNYQPLDMQDPVASMFVNTMPQGYNSDPRFCFTSAAAAAAQQIYRETQSADALDRRGYGWHQVEIKRRYDQPGASGYDPDSKRLKMDPNRSEWGEDYEMKSMRRISEKDQCKERNPSQASDSSHYTLADQALHSNSSGESENGETIPLLPKK